MANYVYYLSGPMSGHADFNYPAFEEAAIALRAQGKVVLSPHELDFNEDESTRGSKGWTFYMKAGIKLLMNADAIVMLPGYNNSTGARIEKSIAIVLGYPAFVYDPADSFIHEI